MNKTLMLIICDFLLLSMLALADFEAPEATREAPRLDAARDTAPVEAELIDLLEASLEAEQTSRSNLSENLDATRRDLEAKARRLAERKAALREARDRLESTEAEAEQLAAAKAELAAEKEAIEAGKAALETEREAIAKRLENTQNTLQDVSEERVRLAERLSEVRAEAATTGERLSQKEADLLARENALAEREAALEAAREEARELARERERLNRELEVARTEQQMLARNLAEEQAEKERLQTEKEAAFARADRLQENVGQLGQGVTRLGENVSQLGRGVTDIAQRSERIEEEIEAARPRTMSEIFTRFQNNRAAIRFSTVEKALFGAETERRYETKSIIAASEDGFFLVTHSSDTPFAFNKNPRSLISVELEVRLDGRRIRVPQVGFLGVDPRLLFIPLPERVVRESGLEPFPLANQPERWEEAVLVKNDESNFGSAGFRRLTSSPRFLKVERPALGQLFADFAASRGDLAFSKNSRFIGVMTDTSHTAVIDAFRAAGIVDLGARFSPEAAVRTLDRLENRLNSLPQEVR